MADMAFITEFLGKVEGPRQVRGYVPCFVKSTGKGKNYIGRTDTPANGVEFPAVGSPLLFTAMGASGVTIATGCDLGQTDAASLKSFGLEDQKLLAKLSPYIGLKKSAALQRLFSKALLICPEEAQAIDCAVHGGYLSRYVRPAYNKASKTTFDELPKEAQAVVFSVCYQKGCAGVAKDWPKTWSYLTNQQWAQASRELRTGFSKYRGRRKLEGKLLEALL